MTTVATAEDQQATRRRQVWELHRYFRTTTDRLGGRECMTPRDNASGVEVMVTRDTITHIRGVKRCGATTCPKCGPVVAEARALQIGRLFRAAEADGCTVWFVTSTIRHKFGYRLRPLMEALQSGWSDAFSGRSAQWQRPTGMYWPGGWRRNKRGVRVRCKARPIMERMYLGQVRALDYTHGVNGHHPHFHAALIFHPECTDAQVSRFINERGDAYRAGIRRAGRRVSNKQIAWHVEKCKDTEAAAMYLGAITKEWGLERELARCDLKAHGEGRTLVELLRSAALDGDLVDGRLFQEVDQAMTNVQRIVASRSLAESFPEAYHGLDLTDEELAAAEVEALDNYSEVVRVDVWLRCWQEGTTARLVEAVIERAVEYYRTHPPPS